MRKLTPERRRVAAICAACAAIIPSTSIMMRNSHSDTIDFAGGTLIGVALAISIGTFLKFRRTCA